MKILLSSHRFHPSVGGIEGVSLILAQEFAAAGHDVIVITQTTPPEVEPSSFGFKIKRRPNSLELLRLVGWCDVFFHNNVSLQVAWPLLLKSRPWVVAHHVLIQRPDGSVTWRDRLKQWVLHRARNITVSRCMQSAIQAPSTIIGNPYRNDLFRILPEVTRCKELVFLGRLVPDKGLDLLLKALSNLKTRGLYPRLTVIGSGPDEAAMKSLCKQLDLNAQVDFVGLQQDDSLVKLLNQHRLMVIPSRCQEAFGLVALEGAACGCVIVGANHGGLPDAIGPCGVTFEAGNVNSLTDRLAGLLDPGADIEPFRTAAVKHLSRHTAQAIARCYLDVIEQARQLPPP